MECIDAICGRRVTTWVTGPPCVQSKLMFFARDLLISGHCEQVFLGDIFRFSEGKCSHSDV